MGENMSFARNQRRRSFSLSRALATLTLIAAVPLTAGCATVKGLGRDIESVGQAGSEAIN
jgi:entericidin A